MRQDWRLFALILNATNYYEFFLEQIAAKIHHLFACRVFYLHQPA